MTRTIESYTHHDGNCDSWFGDRCSCGLDTLLASLRSPQEEKTEDGAALLPADPSAAVTTEPLPDRIERLRVRGSSPEAQAINDTIDRVIAILQEQP